MSMSDEFDDEIIKEFLTECNEHLDLLDSGFIAIEKDSTCEKTISNIFRSIHSIKGGAGMLSFFHLEKLTHAGESLLSRLRDGSLSLTSDMVTALLKTVDEVRLMLQCIGQTGNDGDKDCSLLIECLNQLATGKAEPVVGKKSKKEIKKNPQKEEPAESLDSLDEVDIPDLKTASVETTVRIDVALLYKLMNLVGELVLSRNQIIQFVLSISDTNFIAVSQRLNLITSELQEGVMKTRMQPIGNVWGKFNRIVRDLAVTCNKKVSLELFGNETELDKTLIEAIKDPLIHIVRNSIDHGIEYPESRVKAGKPEEGILRLKAYHEGGHVNIEIYDDGAGIAAEKIKSKALERGLISSEHALRMTEREALDLIFLPGLSTAEKITNVSGRGVGMDVVRTNIERIGGSIDIQSQVGVYTSLKIKIPLTLAIIPALIVTSQNNRYAIPQISLLELVRIDIDDMKNNIQLIKDTPVYRLRGKLLPLVYLANELEEEKSALVKSKQHIPVSESISIVILQAGEIQFGLVVDQINDTQEIVVKPLSKLLKTQCVFAGATIMGDGKISLILDVIGIARKAGLLAANMQIKQIKKEKQLLDSKKNTQSLLLLRAGKKELMAVPLDKVERIEEFVISMIEFVGEQEVVQYRDSIMPLIRLGQYINHEQSHLDGEKVQVVVHSNGKDNFGLIVDHVYDIVEGSFSLNNQMKRDGVLGTSVVENKATEIIDVDSIIHIKLPNYFESRID